jgi:hypothetical protein
MFEEMRSSLIRPSHLLALLSNSSHVYIPFPASYFLWSPSHHPRRNDPFIATQKGGGPLMRQAFAKVLLRVLIDALQLPD